jgi:hypothetical protein
LEPTISQLILYTSPAEFFNQFGFFRNEILPDPATAMVWQSMAEFFPTPLPLLERLSDSPRTSVCCF